VRYDPNREACWCRILLALICFLLDFGGVEKAWMASASVMRKKVTMGAEVDIRRGERKRFGNTFREERNLLWRD